MKLRRLLVLLGLWGATALGAGVLFAGEYTYQVESAFGDKPKFYFFRFDNDSGEVSVLSHKKGSATDVEWQSVQQRPNPFAFAAQPPTPK